MSVLSVVSVFDMTAAEFGRPFYAVNDASAVRSFADEVNRPDETSILYQHPDDFQLFSLGEFDTGSGQFVLFESPVLLAKASVLAKRADALAAVGSSASEPAVLFRSANHG